MNKIYIHKDKVLFELEALIEKCNRYLGKSILRDDLIKELQKEIKND